MTGGSFHASHRSNSGATGQVGIAYTGLLKP